MLLLLVQAILETEKDLHSTRQRLHRLEEERCAPPSRSPQFAVCIIATPLCPAVSRSAVPVARY